MSHASRSRSRRQTLPRPLRTCLLFELSEVYEVERAKLCPAPEQETAGLMKPPTLVRSPSAPRPVTKEAGVSVSTVPPDPAPSFNPRPERPVLN